MNFCEFINSQFLHRNFLPVFRYSSSSLSNGASYSAGKRMSTLRCNWMYKYTDGWEYVVWGWERGEFNSGVCLKDSVEHVLCRIYANIFNSTEFTISVYNNCCCCLLSLGRVEEWGNNGGGDANKTQLPTPSYPWLPILNLHQNCRLLTCGRVLSSLHSTTNNALVLVITRMGIMRMIIIIIIKGFPNKWRRLPMCSTSVVIKRRGGGWERQLLRSIGGNASHVTMVVGQIRLNEWIHILPSSLPPLTPTLELPISSIPTPTRYYIVIPPPSSFIYLHHTIIIRSPPVHGVV